LICKQRGTLLKYLTIERKHSIAHKSERSKRKI